MSSEVKGKRTGHRDKLPWVIYLVLLIGSGVLMSTLGGTFSYVLFYCILLYIPAAVIQLIYTRVALHIYQDVSGRLFYKNANVPCQISIENAGFLPMGGIRFLIDHEVTGFKEDCFSEEYSLYPRENLEMDNEVFCRYAGNHVVGISRISIRDCFGLFRVSYDLPQPLRFSVLPAVTDVAADDINRVTEEESRRGEFRLRTEEVTPGNDVRKYKTGDPVNRINWRAYARTGEMLVRLPDPQHSGIMSFVIITEKEPSMKNRDYMLEYVVSVADWFVRQSKPVRIVYYDGGPKDCLIEGYDGFRAFYFERLSEIGRDSRGEIEEAMIDRAREIREGVFIFREKEGILERL